MKKIQGPAIFLAQFAGDQAPFNSLASIAEWAAGLGYVHIPVVGGPTPDQVEQVRQAIEQTDGPVLAFCRSGTRSIVTWSIGQALSGERTPAELIGLGGVAGYDLSSVLRR